MSTYFLKYFGLLTNLYVIYFNQKGGKLMNERIKQIRSSLKLTRAEFGKRLGVSGDVINNLERGRVEPKEMIIKLICKEFGVSYQWLVNGLGEMNDSDENEAQEIVDSVMTGDNEFAKKVLVAFARMGEEKWKLIREIIEEIESG